MSYWPDIWQMISGWSLKYSDGLKQITEASVHANRTDISKEENHIETCLSNKCSY